MPTADFSLLAINDERLAALCLSAAPAWVWSADGERLLWANATGCAFFGADSEAELLAKHFGPADPHRRQARQLAPRLSSSGALRLERLRGFGAPLGGLMTCGCARVSLRGTDGILIAAEFPWAKVPEFPERVAVMVETIEQPAIAFAEGRPIAANTPARMLGDLTSFAPRLLGGVREADVGASPKPLETPFGPATLHRAGSGAERVLILLLPKTAVPAPAPARAQPDKSVDALPTPVAGTGANGDAAASRATESEPAASGPAMPDDHSIHDGATPESIAGAVSAAPSELLPLPDDHAVRRRHPLRFTWAMDAEGRFSLGSDEFTHLIGAQTTAAFSRTWHEVSTELALDPEDRVAQAVASRATFSGILLHWPVDGVSGRLPVELSGLPVYGRNRAFAGYRGFGICRDLDGLTRLAAQRRHDALFGSAPAALPVSETREQPETQEPAAIAETHEPPAPEAEPDAVEAIEAPANVVPFRPANDDGPALALTPGETNAFQELARQLSARLESEAEQRRSALHAEEADDSSAEQPHDDAIFETEEAATDDAPARLRRPVPAHNTSLIDRIPVGVLVYRTDRLIHANAAFLAATGYASLAALNKDGGLGALYVGPGVADALAADDGTPIKVSTLAMGENDGRDARLHTIDWDGESALALILLPQSPQPQAEPVAAAAPPPSEARIEADELATILETTTEGVVMFDGEGLVIACNRSAEALFSRDGTDLEGRNLIELFAPESRRAVLDYLDDIKSDAMKSLFEQGRDVLGRAPDGGAMALSVTIGRTKPGHARYFAVFRDKPPPPALAAHGAPPPPATEQARRADEKAASAKADLLARLSHEVRAPVSAIIGFADVMIEERFGALGNERYIDYMKDIRASGERVISIIDDMLDLSRIESGKLDLDFTPQDLNALVEQCVGAMQPQANRERIIIRSSLTHGLPNIEADTQALRQIALTLIGTAIHLANAGGQVIVSTALTDLGEVALRIRDTGQGMNDNEIAAAMAPFRTPSPADEVAAGNGTNLSRAKALIEANRGRFHIKSAPNAGTLIEAVFSQAATQAV